MYAISELRITLRVPLYSFSQKISLIFSGGVSFIYFLFWNFIGNKCVNIIHIL